MSLDTKHLIGIGIVERDGRSIYSYIGENPEFIHEYSDIWICNTYDKALGLINRILWHKGCSSYTYYNRKHLDYGEERFVNDFYSTCRQYKHQDVTIAGCFLLIDGTWYRCDYGSKLNNLNMKVNIFTTEIFVPHKRKETTMGRPRKNNTANINVNPPTPQISPEEKARIEKKEKELEESLELYNQAVKLLKESADKDNMLSAFLYGAACLLEWPNDNFKKAEALKYLFLSTTTDPKAAGASNIICVGKSMYHFANCGTFTGYVPAPNGSCFGYGPMVSNPMADLQRMNAVINRGDSIVIK